MVTRLRPNKRLQLTAAVGGVPRSQPSGGRSGGRHAACPPVGAKVAHARPQLSRDPLGGARGRRRRSEDPIHEELRAIGLFLLFFACTVPGSLLAVYFCSGKIVSLPLLLVSGAAFLYAARLVAAFLLSLVPYSELWHLVRFAIELSLEIGALGLAVALGTTLEFKRSMIAGASGYALALGGLFGISAVSSALTCAA